MQPKQPEIFQLLRRVLPGETWQVKFTPAPASHHTEFSFLVQRTPALLTIRQANNNHWPVSIPALIRVGELCLAAHYTMSWTAQRPPG